MKGCLLLLLSLVLVIVGLGSLFAGFFVSGWGESGGRWFLLALGAFVSAIGAFALFFYTAVASSFRDSAARK